MIVDSAKLKVKTKTIPGVKMVPAMSVHPVTDSPVTVRTASLYLHSTKAARCFCLEKPFYSLGEMDY